MAAFARVTPTGWLQGDDSSAFSRVTPTGWIQGAATDTGTSAALTGIDATAAAGLLSVLHAQAIAGLEVSSALGTVTAQTQTDVSVNLTGLAATAAVGAFAILRSSALSGLAAAGTVGAITASRSHALAGLSATGAVGSITVARTHAISGLEAPGAVGTITPSATQLAWPTSDISAGTWTPSVPASSLYEMIDEAVASDADYDTTTDPSADTFEVKFGSLTDPSVSTGHVIRYRIGAVDGTANFTVSLRQGTSQIASWDHNGIGSLATYAQTLSGAEADAITNYADLRLRFTATKV